MCGEVVVSGAPTAEAISRRFRYPIAGGALLAGLTLLSGLWAALIRIGWQFPSPQPLLPLAHGPLMVCGFFGIVFGLERAAESGLLVSFAAPYLTAVGALGLAAGLAEGHAAWVIIVASVLLVLVCTHTAIRTPQAFAWLYLVAAVMWVIGNVLWARGLDISELVFWWAGFLVLTITGESIRIRHPYPLSVIGLASLAGVVALFAAGPLLFSLGYVRALQLAGAGAVLLAVWIAWAVGVRLTRAADREIVWFVVGNLNAALLWLIVGGAVTIFSPDPSLPRNYDAEVHSMFLGFVFSTVFAHVPWQIAEWLDRPTAFRRVFYVHAILLQLSLVLRVGVSDVLGSHQMYRWSGAFNAAAIVLFVVSTTVAFCDRGQE